MYLLIELKISLNVYCVHMIVQLCVGDLNSASWTAMVTYSAEYLPETQIALGYLLEKQSALGSNPTQGNKSLLITLLGLCCILSLCLVILIMFSEFWRFLEELRARQKDHQSGHVHIYRQKKFDCYVHYCTNQIYQTRELQQCTWASTYIHTHITCTCTSKQLQTSCINFMYCLCYTCDVYVWKLHCKLSWYCILKLHWQWM